VRFQLGNHLGSVALEVDKDGDIISYEEYFPYGGTALIAGRNQREVKVKEYRYSGKERDDSTGLYYYGARYYAPWLGRWISADPAGTVDGLNVFEFVGGNPISQVDVGGMTTMNMKRKAPDGAITDKKGATKKARLASVRKIKEQIYQKHGHKLVFAKKVHQSKLHTGSKAEIVPVKKDMIPDRLLVRHLSTALLAQTPEMTEVQAAISHTDKKIYVASNVKQSLLPATATTTLEKLVIPDKTLFSGRVHRHIKKLEAEKIGAYKDYQIVRIVRHETQHAETKIVESGVNFDYIGGTRRPCLVCSLFFQIQKIDQSKYNPHPGAFWDAKAALLSLHGHSGEIASTVYEGIFYKNAKIPMAHVHDYDTDSEDEG